MSLGNLSPRQKMISVMYLILMAMLALNVSKEVLNAFGSINDTTIRMSSTIYKRNKLLYNDLRIKSKNNPKKYAKIYEISQKILKKTNFLVNHLEEHKENLIQLSGARNEETKELDYSSMDGSQADEYFFSAGIIQGSRGVDLVNQINQYSEYLLNHVSDNYTKRQIKKILNTEDILNKDGVLVPWVINKFENYPLAAQIVFLTQIQADVRSIEAIVLQNMIDGELSNQMQVNSLKALIIPESNTVITGDRFKAKVVLAAYDTTITPKMYLYKYNSKGKRIGKYAKQIKVDRGYGIVNIPTSSSGNYYWGGIVKLKNEMGEVTEYPFQGSPYSVNVPMAVISADKMNILYRGVNNPISVSVPGIASQNIIVKAEGVKKLSNGKYLVNVTNYKGKILDIKIFVKMPTEKLRQLTSKRYRIKDIPPPVGTVRGEMNAKMPARNLKISTIGAEIKNFDFDLKLKVTSFNVKVPGKPTIKVKGNRFSDRAKRYITRANIGDIVVISDIKVKILGNSRYRISNISSVLITINGK